METFIRKIFEGKASEGKDELVHLQFQKFSKGVFENKAMVNARKSGNNFSISTSSEFANEFVRMLAEKAGAHSVKVTGGIISTRDMEGEFEYSGKKQFMGIKQYVIDSEMTGNQIIGLLDKLKLAFFALSFSYNGTELKIKAKAPKSAKPSTKTDEKPKADFCKITTPEISIAKEILFDIDLNSLKKAEIGHNFIIEDIILPKGETDFAKMRELAKRKGKVQRIISIDGKETKKEHEFLA